MFCCFRRRKRRIRRRRRQPRDSNPNWMLDFKDHIQDLPLNRVILPGSHDSGSYAVTVCAPMCPYRGYLTYLGTLAPCIAYNYSKVQNLSFTEQLDLGIRYFDLRVSKYRGGYRLTHGKLGIDFFEGIQEIMTFAKHHPTEILILDVRFTWGFNLLDDIYVQKELKKIVGIRMAPASHFDAQTPVKDFWDSGCNVVVIYPSPDPYNIIWNRNRVIDRWPDKRSADLAIHFLGNQVKGRDIQDNKLFVLQSVLTPDNKYILRHLFSNTQRLAQQLDEKLPAATEKWAPKMNIIMYDIVEYKHLTSEIIKLNAMNRA